MKIQNEIHLNMDIDYKILYLQLQGSVDSKDDRIHELAISVGIDMLYFYMNLCIIYYFSI